MAEGEISFKKNLGLSILKGVITAIFVTLVGVLVFAFIIKQTGLSSNLIRPINQVIKGVSILIGCLLGTKGRKEKSLLKGVLIGVTYAVVSFLLFSALNRSFSLNASFFIDVLFLSLMGSISGAICSLVLKK